jgi:hypothetical protein
METSMKIFKPFVLAALLSGCVAGEYNSPTGMPIDQNISGIQEYSVSTSNEVARIGETSQRFEIRHGDCRGFDCETNRRRIEFAAFNDLHQVPNETAWYGWSIYLPSDFQDLSPVGTILGQAKLVGWNEVSGYSRGPLWDFSVQRGRLVFKYSPRGRSDPIDCPTISISQMRGRWTDIVVYADYSFENPDGGPTVRAWINGRLMCSSTTPLVTPYMTQEANSQKIYMRYGIYNSQVQRWLSIQGEPELPTQVVFYDEVRIGRSREDVDVRMRHQ